MMLELCLLGLPRLVSLSMLQLLLNSTTERDNKYVLFKWYKEVDDGVFLAEKHGTRL